LKAGEAVRCFHHDQIGQLNQKTEKSARSNPVVADKGSALSLANLEVSYSRPGLLSKLFAPQDTPPSTVDRITIDIKKGETLGLVGESGSGKSTILKTIAGMVPAQSGNIILNQTEPLDTMVEKRPAALSSSSANHLSES
jgi:peptide/nickel transport system ATP-binding protein